MAIMQTHEPTLSMVDGTSALYKYDIKSQNIVISLLITITFSAAILNCRSVKQLHTSKPVIGSTSMGGRVIRNEPLVLMVLGQAREILERTGWL